LNRVARLLNRTRCGRGILMFEIVVRCQKN
jgi:hypothetical protein